MKKRILLLLRYTTSHIFFLSIQNLERNTCKINRTIDKRRGRPQPKLQNKRNFPTPDRLTLISVLSFEINMMFFFKNNLMLWSFKLYWLWMTSLRNLKIFILLIFLLVKVQHRSQHIIVIQLLLVDCGVVFLKSY